MFLQEHLYQASFPQARFQITACLFCNVKQFWAYLAAWHEKDQLYNTHLSVT